MEISTGDAGFSSKRVAVRVQKKLLGKMASRNVAKHFISDTTSHLLDHVYRLLKEFFGKKDAEKIVKCVIKMVIKIGVLLRGEHFSKAELDQLEEFIKKFRAMILTVISFVQVEFSYDRAFVRKQMEETQQLLLDLIRPHLSDKSKHRVRLIFSSLGRDDFLDTVFRPQSSYADLRRNIAKDLNSLLEDGELG